MGFNPTRYATLIFEDEDWAGAIVKVKRATTFGKYLELKLLREEGNEQAMERWCSMLEEILVEWNLEDDNGNPLPADAEGIKLAPVDFLDACAAAWMQINERVAAPLEKPLPDGMPSPAGSTQTVESSLNLASLSTPN